MVHRNTIIATPEIVYLGDDKLNSYGTGEVTVKDVSDPENPTIAQRFEHPTLNGGHQFQISGLNFLLNQ